MSKISLTIDDLRDFESRGGESPMVRVTFTPEGSRRRYRIGYYLRYDNGDEGKIPEGYEHQYEGKPKLPFIILTDLLGWNAVPDRYESRMSYIHLGDVERIEFLSPG